MPNTAIPARNTGYQVVHQLSKKITFNDGTVTLGTLPAGSLVISAGVAIVTAFNAATSNVIDIGTSGDGDGFATDLAAGTIGLIVADELATSNDVYRTTTETITANYAQSGTAATAGEGYAYVTYIVI